MEDLIRSDDPRLLDTANPVSALAIIALVLGFVSTLYLINSQLVLIPVLSITLGLIALIRIKAKEGLSGMMLVAIGLFLAVFSLTCVGSYKALRHQHLVSVAKTHANTWLEMVQDGEIYRAHQLTKEYSQRCEPDVNLETFYLGRNTNNLELENYVKQEPEISIRLDGHECELINEGMKDYKTQPRKENFVMQFRLNRSDESKADQVFLLEMRRTNHLPPIGTQWTCSAIENTEPKIQRRLLQFLDEG